MSLDPRLLETFRQEALDNLQLLETELSALESSRSEAEETITVLCRVAHNLKGAAHVAGLRNIGELTHVFEELLMRWRDRKLAPAAPQFLWAQQALEMLRESLRIELAGTTARDGARSSAEQGQATYLRVELSQLDALVEAISEITLARERLRTALESLPLAQRTRLRDELDSVEHRYADLRELGVRLRLVSFAQLFRTLERAAQEVATRTGKHVLLDTRGGDLEVDATIVASLRDPLMHMIRNAVDHGIEIPAGRSARGKPGAGRVSLHALREGSNIVIEIGDDGNGLDRERIAQKARERGRNVEADQLTDEQLADIIFESGFSTAQQVTEISGRGVGMDVVRSSVEQMRGQIAVRSRPNEGCTFRISVPLSLAIIRGFHVQAGRQCFVLPADAVEECLDLGDRILASPNGTIATSIRYREQLVPVVELAALFGLARTAGMQRQALIVRHGTTRLALEVDALHGEQQTVVRALGPLLMSVRHVSGATVLGNSDVALIVDVQSLLDHARARTRAATTV